VLDGHHRLLSCKNLGCKRITAVLVDYFRPDIIVKSWVPLILEKPEVDNIFNLLKNSGYSITETETEEIMQPPLDAREAALGLVTHDSPLKFFLVKSTSEPKVRFSDTMKKIVQNLRSRQKLSALKYIDDVEKARTMITNGEAHLLIKVPHIAKENVIRRATVDSKYPPKTTRHLVPEKVDEYHISLERLTQPNPNDDFETAAEQRAEDEKHMREHAKMPYFQPSIEYHDLD
ncbi:MAG: hypothetical protein ABIF92_03210, partial [archaeon]